MVFSVECPFGSWSFDALCIAVVVNVTWSRIADAAEDTRYLVRSGIDRYATM
jgi:hypothetical protein